MSLKDQEKEVAVRRQGGQGQTLKHGSAELGFACQTLRRAVVEPSSKTKPRIGGASVYKTSSNAPLPFSSRKGF